MGSDKKKRRAGKLINVLFYFLFLYIFRLMSEVKCCVLGGMAASAFLTQPNELISSCLYFFINISSAFF